MGAEGRKFESCLPDHYIKHLEHRAKKRFPLFRTKLYYYLDGVPSHAYMKMLYKYPQTAFPYERLRKENASRGLELPEFELADSGVFAENRYFDVTVEYAKADSDDVLMRITAKNNGEFART